MTSKPPKDDTYFPEDERSSMDWEDDHSADARSAGLTSGTPGKEDAIPDLERERLLNASLKAVRPAGYVPRASADPTAGQTTPARPDAQARPEDGYYPEDERSSMDWEDDHSTDSRSAGLNAGQLAGRESFSPGMVSRTKDGSTTEDTQEHPLPSSAKFVPPVGYVPPASSPAAPAASTAQPGSATEQEDKAPAPPFPLRETAEEDLRALHPSLAASLTASIAYAEQQRNASAADAGSEAPSSGGQTDAAETKPESASGEAASHAASAASEEGDTSSPFVDGAEEAPVASPEESPAATSPSEAPSAAPETGTTAAASDGEVAVRKKAAEEISGPVLEDAAGEASPASEEEEEEDEDEDDDEEEEEEEEDAEDRPMTLRDHLTELRKRITRSFLFVVLGFACCYPFAEQLFGLLLIPLIKVLPPDSKLIYTALPEAFFTYMKVAFVAGIFVASPLIFYQVWAFIAPGLYKEEKVFVLPVAFFSAFFFIAGGAFCFFIAFPFAFEFFMSYNVGRIQAMPSLNEYLSFVLQLLLAFGLIFELPLFVFFLARMGIITAAWMRKMRRYAVLVNVIVAAILTPPDVMSQMLMAGPLLLLYEFSIWIAVIFGRKKPKKEEEEEDSDEKAPQALQAAKEGQPSPALPKRGD